MKNNLLLLILFIPFLVTGKTYYVATDGNDSNNGTSINTPFLTITKASGIAGAGDSILLHGGKYNYSSTVSLSKSGTASDSIYLAGYSGRPLINFSGEAFGKKGFSLSGSYWHIKGIDICFAGDNGMYISGAFNTIEWCSFSENKDSGLQLSGGAHDNKIINCDSYWNADPTDYGDADGFACKMDVGTGNYFYGCRSWLNVDDGWDGYLRGANDVSTSLENCWTWQNGYFKDGTDAGANANGNGFKMGGSDDKTLKHNFTLKNCLCFYNKAKGFDQNNNKGSMIIYNGTSFHNKGNNFSIPSSLATGKVATVINCLSFSGNISLGSFVSQSTNSWMSQSSVSETDFLSIDTSGVTGLRNSDGSLPKLKFMHLDSSSGLIDKGTNVGLPFSGSAPDLGAFEYEGTSAVESPEDGCEKPYFSGKKLILNTLPFSGKKFECCIYNISGCLEKRCIINPGHEEIDCSILQKGLYIVKIKGEKIKSYNKIIML